MGIRHQAETDYASFLAYRDWDFPEPGVYNVFAAAALRAADAHTWSAKWPGSRRL